ncbi:MAG: UDP-N-acetylmuramoyl-L-alanyl-D-glutamate--2,6-diaminopimelate ligase [Ruminococcaceae bacterium]|nr:UDP-N-acetylmuramoyl-L-alanyl-D-glutamate--2,6-diaminopimelate ligase [Oscillospiraceae bacterium]
MLLSELLKGVNVKNEYIDREINDVTDNTKKVIENCAFVCVSGARFDGHNFAKDVLKNGAVTVIVSKDLGLKEQVLVENTREAYAIMCKNLFGASVDKMTLIGITGTNGKTTTAFIVKDILKEFNIKSGLIGTVKNMVGDKEFHTELTTPDPYDMHKLFKMMEDDDIKYCVMETSSQAFHQMRLAGIHFKVGVFTNLTQDHLDYHGTIEEYKKCKKDLFKACDIAVMNADDEASQFMMDGVSCEKISYGVEKNCDIKASDIALLENKVTYKINNELNVDFHIPGDFSVYNSLAAIGAVNALGFSLEDTVKAISQAKSVKGRLELVETNTPFGVIIDYAHTPDGLEKAINAVRGFTKGRVITLFGCGGDRDKTKRPKMGRMATELSDVVIVTTDNPRTEDPDEIIKEILIGTVGSKAEVITITDRSEAIAEALKIAKQGDTILLAGKGHETYQVIGTERVHYDEREVIKSALNR